MTADFFWLLCKKDVKHSLWRVEKILPRLLYLSKIPFKDGLKTSLERESWNNSSYADLQGILREYLKHKENDSQGK